MIPVPATSSSKSQSFQLTSRYSSNYSVYFANFAVSVQLQQVHSTPPPLLPPQQLVNSSSNQLASSRPRDFFSQSELIIYDPVVLLSNQRAVSVVM